MGALLHLLFVIFIAGIFFFLIVAFRIYSSVKDVMRQFRNFGNTSGKTTSGTTGGKRYGADETIIDRRDGEKANRRIFSDNEGEYVDFEEER